MSPATPAQTTRRFLHQKFQPSSWPSVEGQFDTLDRLIAREDIDLGAWLTQASELEAAIDQEGTRRYTEMTCHTDDPVKEKAFLEFEEQISPRCRPRWFKLAKALLAHPRRGAMDKRRWEVLLRSFENHVALFREENIPLEVEDTKLAQQYQKTAGEMTVAYEGQEKTLQMMGPYQESRDRKVRQETWELVSNRRLRDREKIDGLYDRLVSVRDQRARNAGFASFRDYIFRARERWDYTADDCFRFHDAIEKHVVPALRKMHEERRRALKLEVLKPWDLGVDPHDRPPLKPFEGSDQLFKGCREMFHRVHPDFAAMIDSLRASGRLDLESRKGKAPGGYQTVFEELREPFIFMNAAGLNGDVFTFLHEGGHAFHSLHAKEEPILRYRSAPIEFCEVASMGMELLAIDHLDVFYAGDDIKRAKRKELEGIINLFPWIATIDAFQHWVYTHPKHTRDERTAQWRALRKRFGGLEDWTGQEAAHDAAWHRQPHLFGSPFYYVEYGIAQLGALQVWRNHRRDRAKAVEQYRAALKLGGTRPLPELFSAAGASLDLSEKTVAPCMGELMEELAKV
jgi:oligoendopeptidase F